MFMIRKNSLFCKLIRIKTSSRSLFLSYMQNFRAEAEECPCCHSIGNCHYHASYSRSIVDFIKGKPAYHQLDITRLICSSCGHTHAVLPDVIIPYSGYGIFFILRVLAEYFSNFKTVVKICAIYNLTPSIIYRWKELFLSHRAMWLSVLEQNEQTALAFLKHVSLVPAYSEFSSDFLKLTGFSFLQNHADKAALSKLIYL